MGLLFTDTNNATAMHREVSGALALYAKANATRLFLLPESGKLGVSCPT